MLRSEAFSPFEKDEETRGKKKKKERKKDKKSFNPPPIFFFLPLSYVFNTVDFLQPRRFKPQFI